MRTCFYVKGDGRIERCSVGDWTNPPNDLSQILPIRLEDGTLTCLSPKIAKERLFETWDQAVAYAKTALEVLIETRKRELLDAEHYLNELLSP